jgi:hypothetical protein
MPALRDSEVHEVEGHDETEERARPRWRCSRMGLGIIDISGC